MSFVNTRNARLAFVGLSARDVTYVYILLQLYCCCFTGFICANVMHLAITQGLNYFNASYHRCFENMLQLFPL